MRGKTSLVVADPNAAHVVAPAVVTTEPAAAIFDVVGSAVGDDRTGNEGAGDGGGAPTTELGVGLASGSDHAGSDGDDGDRRDGERLTHCEISRSAFSAGPYRPLVHWSRPPLGRFKSR